MLLLLIFSFIAGIVTVLSPCILPILPIVLSGGISHSKKRPLGIITGFILSFTVFTLFLSSIVKATGVSSDFLRYLAVVVVGLFGLSFLVPRFQLYLEHLFSKLSSLGPKKATQQDGYWAGVILGLTLGLLWTPCVGPILASVITLAAIGEVSFSAFFITIAYSIGTAIPLFFIMQSGSQLFIKIPSLRQNLGHIQQGFGVLMLLTSLAIATNLDRVFQTYILDTFPKYGAGLTKFEDNSAVQDALSSLNGTGEASENYKKAPELKPDGEWFNSDPLKIEELRGKVVLIDFWTYSCINCQRTLPYLKSWWAKYKDDGLVIIGVHAPEFEFEKNAANVQKAITDFGLEYPVVQDNSFATWQAYSNHYWPAKYLIDKEGNIVYTHFGEGKYNETEEKIQELLQTDYSIDNQVYFNYANTPETYVGYARIANFSSPESIKKNLLGTYTAPDYLIKNHFAFSGDVYFSQEFANPQAGSDLYFNYDAKNVYLVMAPKSDSGEVRVYIDDEYKQTIMVTSDALYTVVEMPSPGAHLLRLEFIDSNIEVYAFTFG